MGAKVTNIPAVGSDHLPIMIDILKTKRNLGDKRARWGRHFHYENYWSFSEESKHLISDVRCNTHAYDFLNPIDKFLHRIELTTATLKKWSSQRFGNRHKSLKRLQDKLVALKCGSTCSQRSTDINTLDRRIEEFMRDEEMYWHQRSRIAWLQAGGQEYEILSCERKFKKAAKFD